MRNFCGQKRELTEDFVQTRYETNRFPDELLGFIIEDPHSLLIVNDASNIGVWSEQDVLILCFLLINLLDRLLVAQSWTFSTHLKLASFYFCF